MLVTGGDCDGYSAGARVGIALAVVALLLLLYVVYLQHEEAADAAAAAAALTGSCPPCQESMTASSDGVWVRNPNNKADNIFEHQTESGCGLSCAEYKYGSPLPPKLCRDTCLKSNNCTFYKTGRHGHCHQMQIAVESDGNGVASGRVQECKNLVPMFCSVTMDPQACVKKHQPNCENLAFASDTIFSAIPMAKFPPTWINVPGASGIWTPDF